MRFLCQRIACECFTMCVAHVQHELLLNNKSIGTERALKFFHLLVHAVQMFVELARSVVRAAAVHADVLPELSSHCMLRAQVAT